MRVVGFEAGVAVGTFAAMIGFALQYADLLGRHIQIFKKLLVLLLLLPFLLLILMSLHLLFLKVSLQSFLLEFQESFIVVIAISIIIDVVVQTFSIELSTRVITVSCFYFEWIFEEGRRLRGWSKCKYGVFDLLVLVFKVVGGLHMCEVRLEIGDAVLVVGGLLADDVVFDAAVGGEDCLRNRNVHYRNNRISALEVKYSKGIW